jgi:hypothetical protein
VGVKKISRSQMRENFSARARPIRVRLKPIQWRFNSVHVHS